MRSKRCAVQNQGITLIHQFVCVNRSPLWYGFRARAKAISYRENTA